VYNTAVEMLLRYTNQKNINFEDIDYGFLNSFQNDLLKRGVGVNTISIYLRTIRATFNKAMNEGLTESYPFKKFRIRQQPTPSRTLTVDELKKIINYKCSGDREFNRDLFVLSFCLIGINFSDLFTLRPENLVDGRIIFSRKKTHKVYSIALHKHAADLIDKWRRDTEYLLPVIHPDIEGMAFKKKVQQAIHVCNNYMKKIAKALGIPKPVSTYYARYSWANTARSLGYSKDLIAEALGHEYGNKVTGIYLDAYDKKIIDAANTAVIELVTEKH
jgi:integrase/recombinase XerD